MNKRILSFTLLVMFVISAMPIQGMSLARRLVGSRSAVAAARTTVARVGSSMPTQVARVAKVPVRSLAKMSGRPAINPAVAQVMRQASTRVKVDLKKILPRIQEVGGAIAVAGVVGFAAHEGYREYSARLPEDLQTIFEENDANTLSIWFRHHRCDKTLQQKIIQYCIRNWNDLQAIVLLEVVRNLSNGAGQAFTKLVVDDFAELSQGYYGRMLLWHVLDHDVQAAQKFAHPATDNFAELVDSYEGRGFLVELIQKNEMTVQLFAQPAASNLVTLLQDGWGETLLHTIMNQNTEAVLLFTQAAVDNFAELAKNWYGYAWLNKIMDKNAEITPVFAQAAVDNFAALLKYKNGHQLLNDIMDKNLAGIQLFTQAAADNFVELVKHSSGYQLLNKVMDKDVNAVQVCAQPAADNFVELIKDWRGYVLLNKIVDKNVESVAIFAQAAVDNFAALVKNSNGCQLLNTIVDKDVDAIQIFAQLAADNFAVLVKDNNGRGLLVKIIENDPKLVELFAQAAQQAGIETDFTLLLQIQAKHARGEQLSSSEAHLLANEHLVLDKLSQDVQKLQRIILMDEHRLLDSGYVSFYHAQSNEKWLSIELDTFLYGIQSGEQIDELYLMHTQADPLCQKAQDVAQKSSVTLHEAIMHDYLKVQDGLERERLICESKGGGGDRKRMLFLNGSLRGNISNGGSQSFPGYFIGNYNAGGKYQQPSDIMRDVFNNRGLECMYEQFKDELQQLHKEYIELSKYGTLYQIAIPRDKVKQVVRPAVSGGGKVQLSIGGEKTEDMHKIIAASQDPKMHPGDRIEFAAPMTYDENGLMNPKCGAKIRAYMIPTDEAAYQEWCAKWEDLKLRMKVAVERTRPADYIAPAHAQELVGLMRDVYTQSGLKKSVEASISVVTQ